MSCCSSLVSAIFHYNTVKTVQIRSKTVGFIFRLLQLSIIGYIIGYVIVYKKGYQEYDYAVSSVATKVKGIGVTCMQNNTLLSNCSDDLVRVWDTVDYVVPPEENNALFVITNSVEIPRQIQSIYDEDPSVSVPGCVNDTDCFNYKFMPSTNGVFSGTCNNGRCQIFAWGPIETKAMDAYSQTPGYYNQITQVPNFTVFIKNNVLFPHFGITFSNLDNGNLTATQMTTCHYNNINNTFCPIFTLATIANLAGIQNYQNIIAAGAIIAVQIQWNCDLDSNNNNCIPVWSFSRLDNPNSTISVGYNFRFGYYTQTNSSLSSLERALYKVYGTRIVFTVSGVAAKFSFVQLIITIGSGIGILGVSTVICDLVVIYILEKRQLYAAKKYETVVDTDFDQFVTNVTGVFSKNPETERLLVAVNP